MNDNKKKPKDYTLHQFRDDKHNTFHEKMKFIVDYIMENNPDNLEDFELSKVNKPYIMKKAINQLYKEFRP